jgi:protein gp37
MAENSKIQWTTHTFNPWRGCTKVSEGCQNCYAERDSHRNPGVLGVWGKNGTREVAAEAQWKNPPKWNREAQAAGVRARVFCASLADVFEGPDTMPESDGGYSGDVFHHVPTLGNDWIAAARDRLFELIHETPSLDWLLLTKRPQNVLPLYGNWLHWTHGGKWPANVWIGASVENQRRADERGPELVKIRQAGCRVAFMSCEPLLEGIDVRPWLDRERGANWVICGGESGAADKVRSLDPHWARMLRDQCDEAGVPYFFKQLGIGVVSLSYKGKGGELDDIPEDLRVREFPLGA